MFKDIIKKFKDIIKCLKIFKDIIKKFKDIIKCLKILLNV